MKKRFHAVNLQSLILVCFLCLTSLQAFSQDSKPFSVNESPLPAPTGFVNDYAGVLDANNKQQLESRIKKFKETSNPSVELAVAIVKTTGDRPIFDYSLAVARGWKIGSKADDNPSALLFIAIDDHKYFTQISRDLEDELPDGLAGQLQRQYLVPAFKQGDYGKGISDTIDAYIQTIEAKQTGKPLPVQSPERNNSRDSSSLSGGACCLIILVILMIIIFSRGSGGGRGGRGGGSGGGFWLPFILGSILNSSGGSSGGSSWGGGSSGGSDWGGFGGGGDFGGGGAGGSW
ncbi:MAG: TPM domain-containing protein [Pyrinomonadaceae bacterium]